MQFIKIWILRYKLAQIFKRAEQAFNLGRLPGNEVFVQAHQQAMNLVIAYHNEFKDFDIQAEVPALADLEKLTIKPEPVSVKAKAVYGVVLAYAIGFGAGSLAAAAVGGYHLCMHLLRLIGG